MQKMIRSESEPRWWRPGRSASVLALVAVLLLPAVASPRALPRPVPVADVAFLGGVVHTMDAARTRAQAVAVRDGRIDWIGDEAGARSRIGEATEVIDLAGGMLLPGFQDAHVHPLTGGIELGECDLNGTRSLQELQERVGRCHERLPAGEWLRGGGFDLPLFPAGNPQAAMLDAIVGDRPVYLRSADGHSSWVSTAALRLAGVDAGTPDPPAGRIERDEAGRPTGTLRETAAMLVARHLPPYEHGDRVAGLRRGLALAATLGITALQEASAGEAELRAYADLARRGELSARVSVSLRLDPERGVEQIGELARLRRRHETPGLRVGTVKIFGDGVLEGQTAAVLEPYLQMPEGYRGEATFEPEALRAIVAELDAHGFQVHVHAIGDRAIRDALDAFEHARRVNGARDARHHIAHVQLVHPDDLPRFARLGVAANFSPLWAYADVYVTELTNPFIGPERALWQYPIGSLSSGGATVVFGSDWSVSSMDPLLGIQVGLTRAEPYDEGGEAWLPRERADLDTMLAGYTIAGAWVNFLDATTGSIEIGKEADLVALDRDLTRLEPRRIGEARAVLTMLGGRVIHRDGI